MERHKFTVDTHLFRELGELLVGRDSTALVELVKNAYDADATFVEVYGENLGDPQRGTIRIVDDGLGMTSSEFVQGFLRIAARTRRVSDRRSRRYRRRFTGAKGIGRLAAHKLARNLHIETVSCNHGSERAYDRLIARIDWDAVEQGQTLDNLPHGALEVIESAESAKGRSGTEIALRRLRRSWSPREQFRFTTEIETFNPPRILTSPVVPQVIDEQLLFAEPYQRESDSTDPGCRARLLGDFETGESYWKTILEASSWLVEIDARSQPGRVLIAVAPTKRSAREASVPSPQRFVIEHPNGKSGPLFQSRILVREGQPPGPRTSREWMRRASGIRVYLEGFRVLPYGEPGNDWLSIDLDYSRRLPYLPELDLVEGNELPDLKDRMGLLMVPTSNYVGAVFLTEDGAPNLQLLVNREGFLEDDRSFESLVTVMRAGINLLTRVRAAASEGPRAKRRAARAAARSMPPPIASAGQLRHEILRITGIATDLRSISAQAGPKDIPKIRTLIGELDDQLAAVKERTEEAISEVAMLRILASVGTQMAAFTHEIHSLLGIAKSLEDVTDSILLRSGVSVETRSDLRQLRRVVADLRRYVERHASYLTDVVTPDARRRRSRQKLRDRFETGKLLVAHQAEWRDITIINDIPQDLRSPPMFPAELTTLFSNLLTNAVKAAGNGGCIRAWEAPGIESEKRIIIENTGVAIDFREAENWFRPFQSTTTAVEPVLGQGMGMGLTIARRTLEDYGAEIRFKKPTDGYATAVELVFH